MLQTRPLISDAQPDPLPPGLTDALACGAVVLLLSQPPVLVASARHVTAAGVNLMAREARGLICHAMRPVQMLGLGLSLLPTRGTRRGAWCYATSYEAAAGCSTGISAADRATTLNAGAAPRTHAGLIRTPGHVMPVLASEPGTDAASEAVVLLERCGIEGGAALCALLDENGDLAEPAAALALAERLGLAIANGEAALPQLAN